MTKLKFMNKTLFVLIIYLINNLIFGQNVEKINGNMMFGCGEKIGLTETEKSYILTISYDSKELKYNINENPMTTYSVIKKTDEYIVGKDGEGNHSFYSIKKRQFYFISNFMKIYITAGYGSENSEIKQTVLEMMEMLKNRKNEKNVIEFLIKEN